MDMVPNKVSTRLKLKIPIKPQLMAPMITKTNAILSMIFIKFLPFIVFLILVYAEIKKIYEIFWKLKITNLKIL